MSQNVNFFIVQLALYMKLDLKVYFHTYSTVYLRNTIYKL